MLSLKIPEFCNVGKARSQNSIFRVFRVPFNYPAHMISCRKQFYPKPMVPSHDGKKDETPKVCLLLVRRVCDQAFGRYRPRKGAEKWSRDHYEN